MVFMGWWSAKAYGGKCIVFSIYREVIHYEVKLLDLESIRDPNGVTPIKWLRSDCCAKKEEINWKCVRRKGGSEVHCLFVLIKTWRQRNTSKHWCSLDVSVATLTNSDIHYITPISYIVIVSKSRVVCISGYVFCGVVGRLTYSRLNTGECSSEESALPTGSILSILLSCFLRSSSCS